MTAMNDLAAPANLPDALGQLPDPPAEPSAPDLDAAAAGAAADPYAGVPSGANGGPLDAADVLNTLPPIIDDIRGRLASNAAAGFLVTAGDRQRHAEVSRLLDQIASILAERA